MFFFIPREERKKHRHKKMHRLAKSDLCIFNCYYEDILAVYYDKTRPEIFFAKFFKISIVRKLKYYVSNAGNINTKFRIKIKRSFAFRRKEAYASVRKRSIVFSFTVRG